MLRWLIPTDAELTALRLSIGSSHSTQKVAEEEAATSAKKQAAVKAYTAGKQRDGQIAGLTQSVCAQAANARRGEIEAKEAAAEAAEE